MNRPRPKLGTIAIAVYLVTTPAVAAEFTRTPQVNGPDVITIRGEIEAGDDKKFIEIAFDMTQASVVLNVKGGRVWEAMNIGRFIRLRNFETRVHNGAVCNSACTFIWLAGTFRHLDRHGRLGFHSTAKQNKPPYERSESGNAMVAVYMAGMGVPQQVIDLQPKADPCCLNYIDYAKAKAWGLLSDRSAKQQQALPAPKAREHGSQEAADLAKAGTCRCVNGQLLPSDCKGACLGSICLGLCKPDRPIAEQFRKQLEFRPAQQRVLPTPAAQQPAGTVPASPKIDEMLVVRSVTPSPQPVPPDNQQPATAATPNETQKRIEPASQQVPVAQKVVLYEEDPADPNGKRFVGSAIWRTETVTPAPGQPPELAIRADIEVPERNLAMTWSLRRNTDKGLPATHVVEMRFKLPADFPTGGIFNVPGLLMKQGEQTRGVPLAGLSVKVTAGSYLIGLSNRDADKERNLQLLKERGWFDIPVVYNNNRRAILAMEKGTSGERAFADAFKAWNQYAQDDAACRRSGQPGSIAMCKQYDDQRSR
jgi:hypothetical protein